MLETQHQQNTALARGAIMAEQTQNSGATGNAGQIQKITRSELPLHCPTEKMALWDAHPRVFLPIEDSGKARCPYCGTEYELID